MSVDLIKGRFDITSFNQEFLEYSKKRKEEEQQRELEKLKQLNQEVYRKKISEMTLNEIIMEWKQTWITFLNNLIHFETNREILFEGNTLFFIGMTIIMVILFFIIFYLILRQRSEKIDKSEKIIRIALDIPKDTETIFTKFKNMLKKQK